VSSTNAVAVANEKVSIVTACRLFGVELPEGVASGGRSRKVHCPFGEIYHSDGGIAPAMRIYPDTNSAYCFSCAAYWTPVALAAKAMDSDRTSAALRLLDHVGYRPLSMAEQWRQVTEHQPELDKALLADALKTYCRRIDARWSSRQFEPAVAAVLTRCLALLDLVESGDDVELWLERCKTVMARTLHSQ
jgi:hypothetical protein